MSGSGRLQASFNSSCGVKAFAVQYISIILIILTFIVGAFSGNISSANSAQQLAEKISTPVLVGQFELPSLFTDGEAVLEQRDNGALEQLLLSHDLKAEVRVGGGASAEDNSENSNKRELELALARSVALYRHLLSLGIPKKSLEVWAQPAGLGNAAKIDVSRERS